MIYSKKIKSLTEEKKKEIAENKSFTKIKLGGTLIWIDYVKLLMFMVYITFATVSTFHLYDLFRSQSCF